VASVGGARSACAALLGVLAVPPVFAQSSGLATHVTPPGRGLPVKLSVDVALDSLHPAASQGALECGAIAGAARTLGASRETITDHEAFVRVLHGPAHYLGQSSTVPFPIADRGYHGRVEFATTLSAAGLTDPATRAPYPEAVVLAGCWLILNGRPASADGAAAAVLATANNVHVVVGTPVVVTILTPAAASGRGSLAVRGNLFVPGPVALTATLGGAASTATGTPAVPSSTLLVPQSITASGSMSVVAGYVLPAPITGAEQMNLTAGFVTPAPITVDGAAAVVAGFVVPAPISSSGSLSVAGAPSLTPPSAPPAAPSPPPP
jgi:hypothetical protein